MNPDITERIVDAQREIQAQGKVMRVLSRLPDEAAVGRVLRAVGYILKAEELVPGILAKLVVK